MSAPWTLGGSVESDRKPVFALGEQRMVCTIVSPGKSKKAQFEADARLIAAAPDHALICWAMCVQDGKWDEWVPYDGSGEFVFAGLRYATRIDEFGCPKLTPALRAAILRSQGAVQ